MAEVNLEIEGKAGDISAYTFRDAFNHLIALLREYDVALSRRSKGSLGWYISRLHNNGSLLISFESRVRRPARASKSAALPDYGPEVATSLVNGFEVLERERALPPYLSEIGLGRIQELTELIGKNGTRGFRVSTPQQSAQVTREISTVLDRLLYTPGEAIGSVEGRLLTISVHKRMRFVVYNSLDQRGISCEYNERQINLEAVKAALGSRVVVSGVLRKNANGQTIRMTAERLRVLEPKPGIDVVALLGGSDPRLSEGLTAVEYIRSVRGD